MNPDAIALGFIVYADEIIYTAFAGKGYRL
jgi:hypothetical protein